MSARYSFAGGLAVLGGLALLAGEGLRFVPNTTPLAPLARMLDSAAPAFLMLTLLCGFVVWALSARWVGVMLVLASLGAGLHLWLDHRAVSLPLTPGRMADLRVVFFNALGSNVAAADPIVTAVLAADPDIVVIAEGEAVLPALNQLQDAYDFVSPCTDAACALVVATKRAPLRFWTLSLNAAWADRYGVAELTTGDGKQFFLSASHLVKPWLTGIAEAEQAQLIAQYNWFSGPVLAVGDFNAAPWGRSLHTILQETGMKGLRWPVATWPARVGALGLPIDHVLVRGGARVVAIRPFGNGLGSNHRGLLADISLP